MVIRVEATRINLSDTGWLFGSGSADMQTARESGTVVVVRAGSSPAAQALLGKTVSAFGRGMYAQYNCVKAALCLVLPDDVSPAEGAASAVNPMTALAVIDAAKRDGHTGFVNSAAAVPVQLEMEKAFSQ